MATSIKTINLIYTTESETTAKQSVQVQSYIELIKVKNEEKEVSSKEFIQNQGKQIANLVKPNETRLVVTNQHELDDLYEKLREQTASPAASPIESTSSPWQSWLELIISGL